MMINRDVGKALVASLSTLRDENARLTGRVGIGEEQARESAARARGLAKELEGEKKRLAPPINRSPNLSGSKADR